MYWPEAGDWRPRAQAGALHFMTSEPVAALTGRPAVLLRHGRILEGITLGWNVAGIIVLAIAAFRARSVALAGFGLDSLIEIGASTVVLWQLSGTGEARQRRALRLIGGAFLALIVESTGVIVFRSCSLNLPVTCPPHRGRRPDRPDGQAGWPGVHRGC
jgi:hypothetical protein